MLKPIRFLLPLAALTVTLPVYAQYTNMIVDDQNRVMPIFFAEPPPTPQTLQPAILRGSQQRYPNKAPIVHNNPPPVVSISPPKGDPIRGPYYISTARHRVMEAAHSAIGIPYIYGGNNPAKGLDCSSLMQFIHKRALGVKLPRTAAAQRDRSKNIRFQDLQPGDLLFFKINARTNHVGIYIGYGKFIHASSSNRRAVISSMDLPYWKKRFVKFGSYLDS